MKYYTERLELKILDSTYANEVLRFYKNNRDIFAKFEPKKPDNYYTLNYQKSLLTCEYNFAIKRNDIRFWVFKRSNPKHIIGTIAIHEITRSIYSCCKLGYKFDKNNWGYGYAKESISKCISIIFDELKLHRIEALVMPSNAPSIQLLQSLNFTEEGLLRQNILIQNKWTDHFLYSLIHP